MNSYFETSAIVKLVIAEEGSEEAGALWDASDVAITSWLAYAEARAVLAAARRSRRLSSDGLSDAKSALEDRFGELDILDVSEAIVRSAALGPEVILVTWDRDLADAGRALGFDLAGTVHG